MNGEVFTRMRQAGVEGKDRRLAWAEWSTDRTVKPSVRSEWARTNPSLGIRLNVSTVADEFAAMSPEMFIRERLGGWDEGRAGSKAVDSGAWDSRVGDPVDGRRVVGVRFTPDGSTVAVAGAVRPDDESAPFFVEAIDQRSTGEGTQ